MSATALIVEDEIFVALDLERILTDAGYKVKAIAADKSGAIEAAHDCSFALVDINLRDGATGPELARTLAADYGIKVVFVTANPGQIANPSGALGYVRKPFSESAILAAAAIASAKTEARTGANDDFVLLNGVTDAC
ncbi:response regulator [Sphingomonas sp. So64.6b]|uniref:response regulator n=1 Tax=Sphingomonas sp. So64.6b TaxID=2997354 RepID=UPI00160465BD|nr:response regulator [Sphingomonas sp. So64.6b]QNA85779.1 response regulator [Sphingomonas sp. So64.6b]